MFMKESSRNISYQIGIRRAPHGLDKFHDCIRIRIIFRNCTIRHRHHRPIIIAEEEPDSSRSDENRSGAIFHVTEKRAIIIASVVVGGNAKNFDNCVVVRARVESTVRPLHVGTLVAIRWTTAPSTIPLIRSIRRAQLAPLLLLFFTLTIASRSNASSNSAKQPPPIQLESSSSQHHHHQQNPPLRNSRTHSSSIVLSRLIQTHFVQKINTSPLRTVVHVHHSVGRTKRELRNIHEASAQNDFDFNLIPDKINSKKRVVPRRFETDSKIRSSKTDAFDSGQYYAVSKNSALETKPDGNSANFSDVVSVSSGNISRVISQYKLDYNSSSSSRGNFEPESLDKQLQRLSPEKTVRPMPPLNGHNDNSSVDKWSVLSIVLSSVTLTLTLGLITCILSHYRTGAAPEGGGTASDQNNAALTPTSAPMLSVVSAGATAGVGGMERLRGGRSAARDLAAARERQVRLHALRTDLAVNLPPSIKLPDGEDHPYSNPRIHIRDPEQEAEIYQKCIRPPPNRTVLESESPPPYRSSSASLLGSSSSSSSSVDWSTSAGGNAPLVVRCHSMSSSTSSNNNSTNNKRPEAGTSGQKTDFLQRTVKIFTGKKTTTTSNLQQAPSPPAPTLPAVMVVPSASRRRPPEQTPTPTTHRPSKGGV